MRAFATLRDPEGRSFTVEHGDLVGRLRRAEVFLDDPRVSEAHALVSQRGEKLLLMALRGRLTVGGHPAAEVELKDNLVVGLGSELSLIIERVVLPETILALEGPGLVRQVLQGVTALVLEPTPRLVPGFSPDADALLWGEDNVWRARLADGVVRTLAAGSELEVRGRRFFASTVPLRLGSSQATEGQGGPLTLVLRYDTVELHAGRAVVVVSGVGARLISELSAFGGPVAWETLALELWGEGGDRDQRRSRFDMAVVRLRQRLRNSGIRDDLVFTTGTGQVQLVLREGDVVEDRT